MLIAEERFGKFGGPESGGGGRDDCDATLFLLLHPVHLGVAFVDVTDFVGLAGVEEDAL